MNKLKFKLTIALLVLPFILVAQNENSAIGSNGMVASAHPLASKAALEILQKGGNAIDASVAAAFVIGVVEPDGSGIGGGGGMVIYLNEKKESYYINYYVKSPENTPSKFRSKEKRHTAQSVCIPGTVAGLVMAHEKFGSLPLAEVIQPAINIAQNGFKIDKTLASLILDNSDVLSLDSATAAIYLDDGFPKMEGDLLIQSDLAKTLTEISKNGRDGFYNGKIAELIVEKVKEKGGYLSLEDFGNYEAVIVTPIIGSYRGFKVLSANIPQSGISVVEGLNILENIDLNGLGHYTENARTLHVIAETFRKIYTDRFYYLGDSVSFYIPVKGLLSKVYAKERFNAINQFYPEPKFYGDTEVGIPEKYEDPADISINKKKHINFVDTIEDVEHEGNTTHLCVIDKEGNAVSLTQTLGTFFGSAQTICGVLLNCGMANFSSTDYEHPNMLEKNKQPRSTIAPTIILKDGNPYLIVGSPGGSRIISTVIITIVNILDFKMGAGEANQAPRFYIQKSEDYLHVESGVGQKIIEQLTNMGHSVKVHEGFDLFFGGVQLILVDQKKHTYHGSADIRRGGNAIGY